MTPRFNSYGKNCVAWKQRRLTSGFTMFELALVAIIFALLFGTLLERLVFYQYEAERAAAEQVLVNLRSALYGKALQAKMQEREQELALLEKANPMGWLEKAPSNYYGEIVTSTAKEVPRGNWYFDRTENTLNYLFSSKKSFPGDSFELWIFKVKFSRLPTKNAKPDGAPILAHGVALIQVDE